MTDLTPNWCPECGGVGDQHARSCWSFSPIGPITVVGEPGAAVARLCHPDRSGSPTWWRFNDDVLLATREDRRRAPAEITRWGQP